MLLGISTGCPLVHGSAGGASSAANAQPTRRTTTARQTNQTNLIAVSSSQNVSG
jgi:hypothetical protein